MTAVMLAVAVMCGTVMGNYQEAQAAEIVAGYGLAEILTSFFMSVGLTIGVKDLVDNGDLQKKLDKWMQSDYDRIYEKYMQSYPNLPDQTPSPIPSPEISPPATVDTDKQLPATYEQLKEQAAADGVLEMVPATFFCLATVIQDLWDNMFSNTPDIDASVPENIITQITNSVCPYYLYYHYRNRSTYSEFDFLLLCGHGSYLYDEKFSGSAPYKTMKNTEVKQEGDSGGIEGLSFKDSTYVTKWATNMPYFDTKEAGEAWSNKEIANVDIYKKDNYWPSTDLKNDYDNNTSPNLPSIAVPPIIRVPTLDEIKELLQQGSDDEENRPTYVTNFITNHTVQPTPEPEPTKKPEVNPNPGGGTDPDPNPTPNTTPAVNPDPGGGTDPDPNPDPNPNPDPDNPDPDNPDPTPEEEASPYKADLREVFPFCIPFDLIHLFKVFDAEPEAPVFKFPLDLELDNPWTGEKVVDYHHEFEFDFSDYEDLIKLLRIIQIVAFITGLMMITRQQMIKG